MTDIRDVTPKDIPQLLVMIKALCAFHGDTCQMGLAETQERFINGPLIGLIAYAGGQPVGYAAIEPRWRPMHPGELWDIAHLYVIEAMRGRGIGRALILAAQDKAKLAGAYKLVIGTVPENPGAAAAYRAMGLAEISQTPGPRFEVDLDGAM
ncbi:MAG: GNAT family N-acetyltransferase [Pseudomonadota bacterium]